MDNNEQRAFVLRETFGMVMTAVLHRSGMYLPEVSEAKRRKFQEDLRHRLQGLSADYISVVPEETHLRHIAGLSAALTAAHGALLAEGAFRVGLAQKALNLYLKHLWCLGWIEMPPHCPIDAIVLAQLEATKSERWSRIDSLEVYQAVITAAKLEAKGMPLAQWELHLSNRAASAA